MSAQRSQQIHAAGVEAARESPVGRIELEGRAYVVMPIGAACDAHDVARVCFDLNGVTLGVFEAGCEQSCSADDPVSALSGRELQIAVLVALGYGSKKIAYRLQISEWTVATYMRRLFAKLDVDNRAAMVFRCAQLIEATLESGESPAELDARVVGLAPRSAPGLRPASQKPKPAVSPLDMRAGAWRQGEPSPLRRSR
jgi:DNA-binding CsgD family transcriptional regulator